MYGIFKFFIFFFITSRYRGGGHKRLYRLIDFKRAKLGVFATVFSIEYDPNRNSRIALVYYLDGEKSYILHPDGLAVGDRVVSNFVVPIKVGNSLPLGRIPLGTDIHNVEFQVGKGGQIARSAGTFARIVAYQGALVMVQLPSGKLRLFSRLCWATIGKIGNSEFATLVKSKAGYTRWLSRTPRVRGVVMNPCDHPHGGGEGRTPIGRVKPVSPWGKPALGKKTRRSKRYSDIYIVN